MVGAVPAVTGLGIGPIDSVVGPKRGSPSHGSLGPMTSAGVRHGATRVPHGPLLLLSCVVGLGSLLLLGVATPVAAGTVAWGPGQVSWTNELVLCQFAPTTPTVNASALGSSSSGLTVGLAGMSEVTPALTPTAVADLAGVSWAVRNLSNPESYDLDYSAQVPLMAPSPSGAHLGSVDVRVDFVLPAYDASVPAEPNVVAVDLSVANWTWQSPSDSLEAAFSVGATVPSAEHLDASTPGQLIDARSNRSGGVLDWMSVAPSSVAQPTAGLPVNVSEAAVVTAETPSSALVVVTFAPAGEFRELTSTAQVGVVLPSSVAGIPVAYIVATGGLAAAGAVGVAVVARHMRARPSKLIYVDEEP